MRLKNLSFFPSLHSIFLFLGITLSSILAASKATAYDVYNVYTYTAQNRHLGGGSMFMIRDKKNKPFLVTAFHVINIPGAHKIAVRHHKGIFQKKISPHRFLHPRGTDVVYIALNESEARNFRALPLAQSKARKGESLTYFSDLNRRVMTGKALSPGWIYLIYGKPGDSGSPVYTTNKKVVGVVTDGYTEASGIPLLGYHAF